MRNQKVSQVGELDKPEFTTGDKSLTTSDMCNQSTVCYEAQILVIKSSSHKYEIYREALIIPSQSMILELEEIQGTKEEIVGDKLG